MPPIRPNPVEDAAHRCATGNGRGGLGRLVARARPHPLIAALREAVGPRHVLTRPAAVRRFATGYRQGNGPVLAVVRPGTPKEQWATFRACVEADAIVIVQAANTGLTGGSTPDGRYDRPVVVINTLRLSAIHLVRDGHEAVCLAGATLDRLEKRLAPIGREPHSVIGSSCIGASVVGGLCNGSGGALVRRGPAYTEAALYARVDADGRARLVNHLGLLPTAEPDELLDRLGTGRFEDADLTDDGRAISSTDYPRRVRDTGADTPARFNADPGGLFEASGSAGKVMVLAARVATFPAERQSVTFYIGTNDPAELDALRRDLLALPGDLPVLGEYLHRGAFDMAARYGKDLFLAVRLLGTTRLPRLFAAKAWMDGMAARLPFLPDNLADRLMQTAGALWPVHLPPRLRRWRDRYEHHLILQVAGPGIGAARALLAACFPSADGDMFECSAAESRDALLHRFTVAGAALRYQRLRGAAAGELVALDVALRRNDHAWFQPPAPDVAADIDEAAFYGHFLCHVFHRDYVLKAGTDAEVVKRRLLAELDRRGAEYPAEHNVGHAYAAKPALAAHYRALDPTNSLNPGIGRTSRRRHWR